MYKYDLIDRVFVQLESIIEMEKKSYNDRNDI